MGTGLPELSRSFLEVSLRLMASGDTDAAISRLDLPLPGGLRGALAAMARDGNHPLRREAEALLVRTDECAANAGRAGGRAIDASQPRAFSLDDPTHLLAWIDQNTAAAFDLSQVTMPAVWGLVALGALARHERPQRLKIEIDHGSQACRFAYAVGLEAAVDGREFERETEEGRTARIRRISSWNHLDPLADEISRLVVQSPDEADGRKTVRYVLIELFRNVLQHSGDCLGGMVAAQRMDQGYEYDTRPRVQVVVADTGIGVYQSLLGCHPEITSPKEALDKAVWPYISGQFRKGETGTYNAGLGLFFISEMAKRTAGRLLIASQGAALSITGDIDGLNNHTIRFLDSGYPGTLVVFELPLEVADYDGLISVIQHAARDRAPKFGQPRVLEYAQPGNLQARQLSMAVLLQNGTAFARAQVLAAIGKYSTLILDFRAVAGLTQSTAHDLLYQALRQAQQSKVRLIAVHIRPEVKSTLDLLEGYAL